ncbi:YegP family protein [Pseudarthrobacter sp. B4EP4b]|uniref:YegP family protein n=1 Tax=Pseudarthrobacter sp. B4EP4b TaxID=2590664 RepID=UPI001153725C
MTGTFEIYTVDHALYAFRLKAPDGTVLAVSGHYSDKQSAVQGIRRTRECAAAGLIADQCLPLPEPGPRS